MLRSQKSDHDRAGKVLERLLNKPARLIGQHLCTLGCLQSHAAQWPTRAPQLPKHLLCADPRFRRE